MPANHEYHRRQDSHIETLIRQNGNDTIASDRDGYHVPVEFDPHEQCEGLGPFVCDTMLGATWRQDGYRMPLAVTWTIYDKGKFVRHYTELVSTDTPLVAPPTEVLDV